MAMVCVVASFSFVSCVIVMLLVFCFWNFSSERIPGRLNHEFGDMPCLDNYLGTRFSCPVGLVFLSAMPWTRFYHTGHPAGMQVFLRSHCHTSAQRF